MVLVRFGDGVEEVELEDQTRIGAQGLANKFEVDVERRRGQIYIGPSSPPPRVIARQRV